MASNKLRDLTPEEISALIDHRQEVIFLPIATGLQARVEIQIIAEPAAPTPSERPTRRSPSARELHLIAEGLLHRVYQFHPVED